MVSKGGLEVGDFSEFSHSPGHLEGKMEKLFIKRSVRASVKSQMIHCGEEEEKRDESENDQVNRLHNSGTVFTTSLVFRYKLEKNSFSKETEYYGL